MKQLRGKGEVVGNKSVVSEMSSNAGKYKSNLEYDCSEIVEDLAQVAGGRGEIITITSAEKYGTIKVAEYGQTKIFDYHTVYSDGKYIYDPRFSNQRIPAKDYMNTINELHGGKVSVSTQTWK